MSISCLLNAKPGDIIVYGNSYSKYEYIVMNEVSEVPDTIVTRYVGGFPENRSIFSKDHLGPGGYNHHFRIHKIIKTVKS